MSDIVERLRSAKTWLNEGDCCGQIDASGTCMAPACIFGEALKLSTEAADEITRLRNDIALLKSMLPPGYNYEVYRIGKGLVDD